MSDVVKQEFKCIRCGGLMIEKRPKEDKFIINNKNRIVRLLCPCGHYEDRVMNLEDFKDNT